jgi:uncharacterized protein YbjT (DUF2867 family)
MIVVTGATGNVGSELVKLLVRSGEKVRVMARNPAKAEKLGGVEIVEGDLEKPEMLGRAFAGAEKLFLLITGPDMPAVAASAAAAAKEAGVKHIVMLSSQGAGHHREFAIGRWHREAEAKVKEAGIPWTMLRPGGFASNALWWAGSIKAQGSVFGSTGEGKSAPIHPGDIAAVAHKALTSPGHEGKTYDLTGPELLSAREQVQAISEAIGRPLKYVDLPEAASREGMLKAGMPERLVNALMEGLALVREGEGSTVTSTVEELLGRPARTFGAWARDKADAFR